MSLALGGVGSGALVDARILSRHIAPPESRYINRQMHAWEH